MGQQCDQMAEPNSIYGKRLETQEAVEYSSPNTVYRPQFTQDRPSSTSHRGVVSLIRSEPNPFKVRLVTRQMTEEVGSMAQLHSEQALWARRRWKSKPQAAESNRLANLANS